MGADAALLRPINGFGPKNLRFGTDFRQLYSSIHAPVLTDGGIDIKFGRQYTPLGYETTASPYRPMYSEAYAWIYSQNGATTGAIATIHVDRKLDVIGGVTLGLNSLFTFRGRARSYILRSVYFAGSAKHIKLLGTLYTGPEPIAALAEVIQDVNRRLTLVSETNFGRDRGDPGNQFRTSQWVGTYGMAIIHAHPLLDVNSRVEWFQDTDGSRIGKSGNYGEITVGTNFMPARSVNFRPEVRWDGADAFVFGPESATNLRNHQWTLGHLWLRCF